jgi:hypothetical protein
VKKSPPTVAFSVRSLSVIRGTFACSPDVVRATAAGYRGTEHDMTDHPGAFDDDMPPAAGAGSPAGCRPPDLDNNGTV